MQQDPETDADRAARSAFRRYCNQDPGGIGAVADRHALNPRTAERLFARKLPVPPSLAAQVAERLRAGPVADEAHHHGMIAALEAWANSRKVRTDG